MFKLRHVRPQTANHLPSRFRRKLSFIAAGTAVTLALGLSLLSPSTQATAATTAAQYGIFANSVVPTVTADPDTSRATLGTTFSSNTAGVITAIRYYKSSRNVGPHTAQLWTATGTLLATTPFTNETRSGWQTAALPKPVSISKGVSYIAAYVAPKGRYADDQGQFSAGRTIVRQNLTASKGLYTYGSGVPDLSWRGSNYYADVLFQPTAPPTTSSSTSRTMTTTTAPTTHTTAPTTISSSTISSTTTAPTSSTTVPPPTTTTTTTTPPSTSFPDASNTGVPANTVLSPYTGPMTVTTPNTVIDAKTVTGTLTIRAAGVKITRTKVMGNIDSDDPGSVSITDSEVDAGHSETAAIVYNNVTLLRVNIHGARQSITCGSNCNIQDSWLHGQYNLPGASWHVNGYISNGGNNVLLRHNTIACDTPVNSTDGGCTGPAAIFADFDVVKNITFDHNLFVASPGAYCLYAGYDPGKAFGSRADNATGIVVTDNTFQRGTMKSDHGTYICAYYGAATSWRDGAAGNLWSGNKYDDGTVIPSP